MKKKIIMSNETLLLLLPFHDMKKKIIMSNETDNNVEIIVLYIDCRLKEMKAFSGPLSVTAHFHYCHDRMTVC